MLSALKNMPGVETAEYDGKQLIIKSAKGKNTLENTLDFLKKENIAYGRIYSEMPTLNDVFLQLTGTELRD